MFEEALVFTMKIAEVGAWFTLDEDTKKGLCKTKAQQKKVGYVNDPTDRGGETKFGIAQKSHPALSIKDLDWEQAKAIYEAQYWLVGKCHTLLPKVAFAHFDACVHHGPLTAGRLLQQAVGAFADGQVGPDTVSKVNAKGETETVKAMVAQRWQRMENIFRNDPTQEKYRNGWKARCDKLLEALC